MTKRTARAQRTQAKNGAGPAPVHLVEPMLAGMTTTRQHLLAWFHAHGLAALDELFREEAVALAGVLRQNLIHFDRGRVMLGQRKERQRVRARLMHVRAQRTNSRRWSRVGGRGVGIFW